MYGLTRSGNQKDKPKNLRTSSLTEEKSYKIFYLTKKDIKRSRRYFRNVKIGLTFRGNAEKKRGDVLGRMTSPWSWELPISRLSVKIVSENFLC